jgi:peptide/nickel transport system ATP-binding protein
MDRSSPADSRPSLAKDGRSEAIRLEVTNLTIGLGASGPAIVNDVSLSVQAGEVLGLVGESGSGKTTVALALSAYTRRGLAIRSGEVCLDGTDLLALRPGELRAIRGAAVAYVPQDPAAALNPALRIGTQLREMFSAHEGITLDPDRRALEVLQEVHLEPAREVLRRYPHQLSGGQQQRVALAMAFSCRPSLIVLDEPTTGLDVTTQRHVLETVRSLCRSYRVAAVYVSHDLAVVGQLVSDVAVMYAGRVIELGSTREVLGDPLHPYTRGLVDAVPSIEQADALAGIAGRPPGLRQRPSGCAFAPRCSFVVDLCRAEAPPSITVRNRAVRCHRAREIEHGVRTPTRPRAPKNSAQTSAPRALSVRSLSASYGSTPVLFDVNFDVETESCMAIVGESGSGKTTLARCIVGMHDGWSGTVSYAGSALSRSARQRPRPILRQVQYVFQNPYTSLNPRKTISQILLQPLGHFFRLSSAERHRRVVQVLEDVSLGADFLARFPDELSGGERQRVAIARALIVEPELLVCDEVTSALDVSVQAVIVELLRALQQERRLSMIFITHNIALVKSIAQSAVVLFQGRIVEAGPVEAVLERPTDPYATRLIEDVPTLDWRTSRMAAPISSASGNAQSSRSGHEGDQL